MTYIRANEGGGVKSAALMFDVVVGGNVLCDTMQYTSIVPLRMIFCNVTCMRRRTVYCVTVREMHRTLQASYCIVQFCR